MPADADMPVRKTMCATCPFREGSPYAHLAPALTLSAVSEGRICHSTGSNAINEATGKDEHLCRGARDFQLYLMAGLNVIDAPTDQAWNDKRVEFGMSPVTVKNP